MGDTGGKHRWTPACLAAIVFLYFMGIGSTVGAFPELLLQRQCDETTDLVKCKSTDAPDKALMDKCITLAGNNAAAIQKCKSDHAHQQQQHDLYDTAQQNSVSQIKLYYLLPGLAGFATVPGIGLLGDMYGRKPVLILIAAGGVLGLTTLRFVSNFRCVGNKVI
jgi:MFS family permease